MTSTPAIIGAERCGLMAFCMASGWIRTFNGVGRVGMVKKTKITPFLSKSQDRRSSGYILLDRRFFSCGHLHGAEERDIFLRMLCEAYHADGKGLKRGQLKTTRDELAEWSEVAPQPGKAGSKWSIYRVKAFIKKQIDAGAIRVDHTRHGMIITIMNYELYQDRRRREVRPDKTDEVRPDKTAEKCNELREVEPEDGRGSTGLNGGGSTSWKNNGLYVVEEIEKPTVLPISSDGSEVRPPKIVEKENDINGLQSHPPGGSTGSYNKQRTVIKPCILSNLNPPTPQDEKAPENLPAVRVPAEVVVSHPQVEQVPPQDRIPYQQIVDLFIEYCPRLPKPRFLTDNLKSQLKARWEENEAFRSLTFWREYFEHDVGGSDFLNGDNDSGFKASIHWVTGLKNMAKVLAGNYVNRVRRMPRPTTYAQMQDWEQRQMDESVQRVAALSRRMREERNRKNGRKNEVDGGGDQ